MRTGRPKVALILTTDERQRLESLAHRSRSAPHVARRARIILACADGSDSNRVARRLHVTPATVCKWRGRFVRKRLDGLYDEPRPGAKRTMSDEQVEAVIVRTLETTPRGATHWSTREMAKAVGMSRMAISRIWHAFGLQPHRSETFKLSTDPLLVEKVRDIVGLYLDPPAHAAVFCVDEKPQIQALDRTQPLLPMQPGQVERRTHDYTRHGTTTLFAALNAKTSDVITQFHQRHRSAQFREFLDLIDAQVPRRLDVHIIMDNYSTHKTTLIRNWFAKRPRFHVHFTPTYGSWLSLVERWFAELTMKQIRRGAYGSVTQLKAGIQEFIDAHQANPKPFVWTKSADEILASIARFAQRTADARAAQSMSRITGTGH
ncbi:MAG TPA: IS630 family transposase [Gemmatimonadales bacterium]|nr:IS630 family transposase [Gemmatimonadales bacterium]